MPRLVVEEGCAHPHRQILDRHAAPFLAKHREPNRMRTCGPKAMWLASPSLQTKAAIHAHQTRPRHRSVHDHLTNNKKKRTTPISEHPVARQRWAHIATDLIVSNRWAILGDPATISPSTWPSSTATSVNGLGYLILRDNCAVQNTVNMFAEQPEEGLRDGAPSPRSEQELGTGGNLFNGPT